MRYVLLLAALWLIAPSITEAQYKCQTPTGWAAIALVKSTYNSLYSCNPNGWTSDFFVESDNYNCSSGGQARRVRIAGPVNGSDHCEWSIHRSKSGPTSSLCRWHTAKCYPAQNRCYIYTYTGSNSCVGYSLAPEEAAEPIGEFEYIQQQ